MNTYDEDGLVTGFDYIPPEDRKPPPEECGFPWTDGYGSHVCTRETGHDADTTVKTHRCECDSYTYRRDVS